MSSSTAVVVVDTLWSLWLWLMVGLVDVGVVMVAVLVSRSSSLTVGVVNVLLLLVFIHLSSSSSSSCCGICHGHGNGIVFVVLAWTCWCHHPIITSVAVQVSLVALQALLVMVVASSLGELRVVAFCCRCRCGSCECSRKVLSIAVNLGLCNQFHRTSALQDH